MDVTSIAIPESYSLVTETVTTTTLEPLFLGERATRTTTYTTTVLLDVGSSNMNTTALYSVPSLTPASLPSTTTSAVPPPGGYKRMSVGTIIGLATSVAVLVSLFGAALALYLSRRRRLKNETLRPILDDDLVCPTANPATGEQTAEERPARMPLDSASVLALVSGHSGRSSYSEGSRYRPYRGTDDIARTAQDADHPVDTRVASPPGLEGRCKLRILEVFRPMERRVSVDDEPAIFRPPRVCDPSESLIARTAYATDGGVRLAGGRPGSEVGEGEVGELLEPPPYSQLGY